MGSMRMCMLISSLDAIGSVGFNQLKPWLLSVAGSRNFDGNASESGDSEDDSEGERVKLAVAKKCSNTEPVDASLKLWDFASVQVEQ